MSCQTMQNFLCPTRSFSPVRWIFINRRQAEAVPRMNITRKNSKIEQINQLLYMPICWHMHMISKKVISPNNKHTYIYIYIYICTRACRGNKCRSNASISKALQVVTAGPFATSWTQVDWKEKLSYTQKGETKQRQNAKMIQQDCKTQTNRKSRQSRN